MDRVIERTSFADRADQLAYFREVDTYLSELFSLAHASRRAVDEVQGRIDRRDKQKGLGFNQRADAQKRLDDEIARLKAELPPLTKALADARMLARVENDRLYGGWSRFFLVQHIHKSMYCSSFRPSTRIGWLPSVSGLTEEEAVAEHGETLCTICYPSAPTHLTKRLEFVDPNVCTAPRDPDGKASNPRAYSRWATCTAGHRVSVTSTGKLRKHKK